jgi:hypothetical protein
MTGLFASDLLSEFKRGLQHHDLSAGQVGRDDSKRPASQHVVDDDVTLPLSSRKLEKPSFQVPVRVTRRVVNKAQQKNALVTPPPKKKSETNANI